MKFISFILFLSMLTGTHAFQKIPDGDCSDWDDRACPIKKAVDEYLNNATITKYGPIKDWDTSLVTDMSFSKL